MYRFLNRQIKAENYIFSEIGNSPEPAEQDQLSDLQTDLNASNQSPETDPQESLDYATIQRNKILEDAHADAEKIKQKALLEAQKEIDSLRELAYSDGYTTGFNEGMANSLVKAKEERERQAAELTAEVADFLQKALIARNELLDKTQEEAKELAIAVAEKVVRVSLRSSSDVIARMIEAALVKQRSCEWVHIYLAECDAKRMASTIPSLTASLEKISTRVRFTHLTGEESGTCIIETPNEILDVSVSTQLHNIRDVLGKVTPDMAASNYV